MLDPIKGSKKIVRRGKIEPGTTHLQRQVNEINFSWCSLIYLENLVLNLIVQKNPFAMKRYEFSVGQAAF